MKKRLIAVSLMVMLVLGAVSAYAYGPGFGPRGRGGPCWEGSETAKGASLTPEQKAKFQELHEKFASETAKLREDLMTKRLELHSLWADPNTSEAVIIAKEKELRDLQNQMKDKGLQFKLERRQHLTPEQISEFGGRCGMGPRFGGGPMKGRGMRPGRGPWN